MLLICKPANTRINHFLAVQRTLPFSYPEVGASRTGTPPGYPINHYRGQLGAGSQTFARSAEALRNWRMYDLPWTQLCWPDSPIAEGSVVAVLAHTFGLWSLNASRIIYVIEETGPVHRFGFAFGTLPGHMEQGEERFTVDWNRRDDSVWYELFAFARPKHPLAKLGYPFTRWVQKRFAIESYAAMCRVSNPHA
ncbi:MAG TPA: DUF1990 domain-containing protein [Herpetosiphonaceae bacterium]|nr:DUF1990 domain-containing protein [Herpetosiphonaceae bacterium]